MRLILLLITILSLSGCSKKPEAINYGLDACQYCQMTIVTKTHAAQMVTDKGKQYKFDAIECMIRFLEDKEELEKNSNLYITNYKSPGVMIDAKTANYLICDEITSPMGANLTGFDSMISAKEVVDNESALYFDWKGVFEKLN